MARRKRKYRVKRIVAQASPAPQLELGAEALAASRRVLSTRRKARALARKSDAGSKAELAKARRRERQAEYRRKLALTKQYGTYAPISSKPTKYRRATVNKKYRQLEDLLKGAAFAEYPKGAKKKTRNTIRRATRKIGGVSTRKGVFLQRGHGRASRAAKGKLVFDRKTGLWEMHLRETKVYREKGRKRSRPSYSVRPLAGRSALIAKERQIKERFDRWPPLRKNERLRFVIDGRNASKTVFRSMESLLDYARKYRKSGKDQAEFLSQLRVEVVVKANPRKKSWRNNTDPLRRFYPRNLRSDVSDEVLEDYDEESDLDETDE